MEPVLGRRRLLQFAVGGAACLALDSFAPRAYAATPTRTYTTYSQPLQLIPIIDLTGDAKTATITARHRKLRLHPRLPAPTNVFRYEGGSGTVDPNPGGYQGLLGPTVVVRRGQPVAIDFVNGLGLTRYERDTPWLPVDKNITHDHTDTIRLLTHQHGGFIWAQYDGNPAVDMGYEDGETQHVWYGNEQRAGLNWYHDHSMGGTRLNVWSGLTGGYLIRDDIDDGTADNRNGLPDGIGLGRGCYELPLVFQDRSFVNSKTSGDFYYPTIQQLGLTGGTWGICGVGPTLYGGGTLPGPWSPEGFGNTMLVNGLVSPFHAIEPRLYRLRLLNGCNARILDLAPTKSKLTGKIPPMWIIGTEGGLLEKPVKVTTLTMMPGERLDVLIDFSGFGGDSIQLKNTNIPRQYVSPAPMLSDGIRFDIGKTVESTRNNTVPQALVGGQTAAPGEPTMIARHIMMNEANALANGWFMALTSANADGSDPSPRDSAPDRATGETFSCFHSAISELPGEGQVQEWDFMNMTMDSHPMHLHLVMFQVVHRRAVGAAIPAPGTGVPLWERGWKDTVAVHPMQITRVRAKFELPSPPPADEPVPTGFGHSMMLDHYGLTQEQACRTYMYHCHILEHEENDMMRPFRVT